MRRSCLSLYLLLTSVILYSQTIPSPSEFLGYDIGTAFTRHHKVIAYFEALANALPNQIQLEQYGHTYEGRPLYLVYISNENNIKNIDEIRTNNLKNAGVLEGNPSSRNTAIIWLGYNVHGNEASSTEAAMQTTYELLTKHKTWLNNSIVIIDPCMNPDGRDRYVNWYNTTASVPYDVDPQSAEHIEPWATGRPNHYLFDLNRDWAWATQIESDARLNVYNKWLPHIHVDFHEQGYNEPYYFAPAAEPFHDVISDFQRQFQTEIGKNHASYFDKEGWLFFTRERFDLFYPSYGDTYPTYMGAIGMTYEQAGHGRGGLGVQTDEGTILTLVDRLTHHTITGLSTIEIASNNAERLNTEFSKFFNPSDLKYKSYVLTGHNDRINALKTLLDKHEIKYERAVGTKASGYHYATKQQRSMPITSNNLVVHSNQPKGKMVKVLFEPNAKLKDSLTYDITAWSLPYAYGLDAVASVKKVPSENAKPEAFNQILKEAYAYVSGWNSTKDARFLAALLNANFKVRFTEKPFTSNGTTFKSGSLIIRPSDNTHIKNMLNTLNTIATQHQQKLATLTSGLSDTTPDIGSPDIHLINKQRVAMLRGKGISSLDYGALWHFFEQQLHYPITSINTSDFQTVTLDRYNVLLLPNGDYTDILNEHGMKKLNNWINQGGKVIAIGSALNKFADSDGFNLKIKTDTTHTTNSHLIPYAEQERQNISNAITGAIFKTHVDHTHPMAFGYDTSYFTLKLGNSTFNLLDEGYNVAFLKDADVYAGFAGKKALQRLDNTLIFGEERHGKGSVIYMVDNPLFRGFWEHGKLFLVNSIFFVNNTPIAY